MKVCLRLLFLVVGVVVPLTSAFIAVTPAAGRPTSTTHRVSTSSSSSSATFLATTDDNNNNLFDITVDLPPTNSNVQVNLKIKSILSVPSDIVVVRYKLPFGLDVSPKNSLAVCTKDGAGGEQVGDVLRYTSQWRIGMPQGDGIVSTVASFGGGVSWQCSIFNVMEAEAWDQVVEALVSNVPERTDEVLLIFERPLEEAPELQ